MPFQPRACRICGSLFTPSRAAMAVCGDEKCRRALAAKHARDSRVQRTPRNTRPRRGPLGERPCRFCGRPFAPKRVNSTYCAAEECLRAVRAEVKRRYRTKKTPNERRSKAVEEFTLVRSGNQPLRFTGELIAESDGERLGGREQSRWHNLAVYRTASGKYVLAVVYRTRWQGELDREEATVHGSPAEVADELRGYSPAAHTVGYPDGVHYADKQARLIADVCRRFESQVSDVLASDEFAERIE